MQTNHKLTKFENLTARVRFELARHVAYFHDAKRGAESLLDEVRYAGQIGWVAEDLAKYSHIIRYCHEIATWMGNVLQEWHESSFADRDAAELWLDGRAEYIIQMMTSHLVGDIMRGVETSSNPMTIIVSNAKCDAARHVLENICQMDQHTMSSHEVMTDIFAGRKLREEERQRARKARVVSIEVVKGCEGFAGYSLLMRNADAEILVTTHIEQTRKETAMVEAREVAAACYPDVPANAIKFGKFA